MLEISKSHFLLDAKINLKISSLFLKCYKATSKQSQPKSIYKMFSILTPQICINCIQQILVKLVNYLHRNPSQKNRGSRLKTSRLFPNILPRYLEQCGLINSPLNLPSLSSAVSDSKLTRLRFSNWQASYSSFNSEGMIHILRIRVHVFTPTMIPLSEA